MRLVKPIQHPFTLSYYLTVQKPHKKMPPTLNHHTEPQHTFASTNPSNTPLTELTHHAIIPLLLSYPTKNHTKRQKNPYHTRPLLCPIHPVNQHPSSPHAVSTACKESRGEKKLHHVLVLSQRGTKFGETPVGRLAKLETRAEW